MQTFKDTSGAKILEFLRETRMLPAEDNATATANVTGLLMKLRQTLKVSGHMIDVQKALPKVERAKSVSFATQISVPPSLKKPESGL